VHQKRRIIGLISSIFKGKTGMGRINTISKHDFPPVAVIYFFIDE